MSVFQVTLFTVDAGGNLGSPREMALLDRPMIGVPLALFDANKNRRFTTSPVRRLFAGRKRMTVETENSTYVLLVNGRLAWDDGDTRVEALDKHESYALGLVTAVPTPCHGG